MTAGVESLARVGRIGAWAGRLVAEPASRVREAAFVLEEAGYDALWYGENVSREVFGFGALLLTATKRARIAAGIANIWVRDATVMLNGANTLGEAWDGRFILGMGVSHKPLVDRRGHDYEKPLAAMIEYLDAYDAAAYRGPQPPSPVPVVLGALGPRMLALAGNRTAGAHPYFVPLEHTAGARQIMGPRPWLAPEQAAVLSSDPTEARAVARGYMQTYLALPNYRNSLLRLGWTARELEAVPNRLVDALIAWGRPDDIADRLAEHLNRGADHVSVQFLPKSSGFPLEDYLEAGPAIRELSG